MNRTMNILGVVLTAASLCLTTPAFAQTPGGEPAGTQAAGGGGPSNLTGNERRAAEQRRSMVSYQARQTVEQLFNRLCPGRCELVELNVEMGDPKPVGEVAPGFESVTGNAFVSEPNAINATVLLDSKLPRNFQSNIPRMLQYRLSSLAPTVNVRPEVLDFPEPQLQPMPPMMPEPPRRQAEPPPMPEPVEEPVAEPVEEPVDEAAAEEEAVEKGWWAQLQPFLKEIAPWIGPILMVLVLFGLLLVMLRRLSEMNSRAGASGDEAGRGRPERREADVEALRADLTESRAVRNQVLRRWLEEDEEQVARLVRLLGPDILSDLKSDGTQQASLERVSELVAREREPLDEDEVGRLANETEARLTAARVVHDEQGLARDWEFLEGLGVANLRRILRSCSTGEKIYVVGQLPSSLRSAYLGTLDEAERRDLFLGTNAEVLSKEDAISLAARLRKAAEDVSHIGKEAEGQASLVIDMLEALPLDDQEEALRELKGKRPEVAQAVLGRICLETTTLQAPGELLADAIHRTPVETLAAFLRGTRADIRDHILSVAPSSKREAIMTELSLDVPVGKTEFLESRDTFTNTLKDVLLRDGHDLARANTRALMRTSKINPVTSNEASV